MRVNSRRQATEHTDLWVTALRTSSSSIWKHWKLVAGFDVTRASFCARPPPPRTVRPGPRPGFGTRAGNNLLGAKGAGLDQLAYPLAGNAFSAGLVGMDAADTADRADPVRCPGLTLPGWHGRSVESGSDVVIGPQRLAMLRITVRVFGAAACSRGLRRRSSECCPPVQWGLLMQSTLDCWP